MEICSVVCSGVKLVVQMALYWVASKVEYLVGARVAWLVEQRVALLEYEKAFERAALTVAWLDEKRVGVWVDAKVVPRVFWMAERKATPRAV